MDVSRNRSNKHRDEATELYDEIRALSNELSTGQSKVTKRRATGARLLELLSKEKNRNKLNEKATTLALQRGYSHAKARRWAVSVVWTPIITSAFNSAQQLARDGKCKLTADDVKLPLRLLHFSDKSTDGHQIKLESTCKLEEKNVRRILQFCFEMLEDDTARELAELELMSTLIFLCERVDYVSFLRPVDVLAILSLVESCLSDEQEGDIEVAAARMFGAVLESCYELGIGLHLLVSRSVQVVARWCKNHIESVTASPPEQAHLFRGLTALLRFDPDQAIKPLTRYGRIILRWAKRSYQGANASTRHAVHGYLIAHL